MKRERCFRPSRSSVVWGAGVLGSAALVAATALAAPGAATPKDVSAGAPLPPNSSSSARLDDTKTWTDVLAALGDTDIGPFRDQIASLNVVPKSTPPLDSGAASDGGVVGNGASETDAILALADQVRLRVMSQLDAERKRVDALRTALGNAQASIATMTQQSPRAIDIGHLNDQLAGFQKILDSITSRLSLINPANAAPVGITVTTRIIVSDLDADAAAITAFRDQVSARAAVSGSQLIDVLLEGRCQTAICFNNGSSKHWLGIEPLVELPVGKSFAIGTSSISDYVNNHDIRVDLAAGLRVWAFRDVLSLSLYISKPLTSSNVRLKGSTFSYPGASVVRPYPGVALGLLYDSIWLGFDRDELRNGDSSDTTAFNAQFPPNQVVSSTWTVTLALEPVTAFRSAIGAAVHSANKKSDGSQ